MAKKISSYQPADHLKQINQKLNISPATALLMNKILKVNWFQILSLKNQHLRQNIDALSAELAGFLRDDERNREEFLLRLQKIADFRCPYLFTGYSLRVARSYYLSSPFLRSLVKTSIAFFLHLEADPLSRPFRCFFTL